MDVAQGHLDQGWALDWGLRCSLFVGNGSLAAMLSDIPRKERLLLERDSPNSIVAYVVTSTGPIHYIFDRLMLDLLTLPRLYSASKPS